jgi:predicted metal-binding protein
MASKRRLSTSEPKLSQRRIIQAALKLGAIAAKIVRPSSIETAPWVRWKCQFGCGGYGSSLVCPPHSPTPKQTRAMLGAYKRGVLFESPRGQPKRIAAALERQLFLAGFYKAFGLGAGPCHLCDTCAFERGCRHPHEARPAMEACGIDVYASARKHGFTINVVRTRRDRQHYFGLVLID